ncbi:YdcF family protein [Acinetobacter sp. MD2]|uniref:YdcF family protein n=1 Tax=Acinetobacter sp. MD2 TaxID=2600066 RepID=UPI002D1F0583|nr:YdcF family protein [Acinetobacter sp. MD2]MEB3767648.1 YdcF family protein [Acinetobacter sp. MD2]
MSSLLTPCCRIFLFVIGSLLCIDSLYLLALGKIHIGILLPLLLGSLWLLVALKWKALQYFLAQHPKYKHGYRLGWCLLLLWLCSFALFGYMLQTQSQNDYQTPKLKAIIVLGSGTINGQPSPTLALRLDRAAQIAMEQPQARLVLSGGIDFAEQQSEARVMANYLQHKYHLSPKQMILEDQSTSTALNLSNSAKLLQQHHVTTAMPIAIVTSDFHTIRAHAIAQKQGYSNAVMLGAETPLQTRYNAWLREYFAFISGKILQEY